MRTALVVGLFVALTSMPAFAQDGNVSQATLKNLGLGGVQLMSDSEGLQIRGMSSNAESSGQSLIVGQLVDPLTNSFAFGSDTNRARGTAENAGLNPDSDANHTQGSALTLSLTVGAYTGALSGGAGFNLNNFSGIGIAHGR